MSVARFLSMADAHLAVRLSVAQYCLHLFTVPNLASRLRQHVSFIALTCGKRDELISCVSCLDRVRSAQRTCLSRTHDLSPIAHADT
jgi:hypothetical protein